jgi:TRAP-type C4-dicarboxylate transport system substrate-binding protein
MKRVRIHFLVLSMLVAAAILFPGAPAQAADKPVELRLAHMFPSNSPWHEHMEAWAKKIAADSKGRLAIRIFPANNLVQAPALYDAVVSGATDFSYGFRYMPKGQPIGVTFPFVLDAPDTVTAAKVYDDLWKKFPKVLNEEWKEVKILYVAPTLPQYLTTRKPLRRLDDIKGLQIRVPSKEMGEFMKGLGAAPVFMSVADFVVGLEKGTIDGVTQALSSIPDYKLARTLKTILMHSLGVVTPRMLIMNKGVYDRLPADLQSVVSKSGEWGKQGDIQYSVEAHDTALKYCKTEGIEMVSLSKEDSEKYNAIAERTRDQIGAELDAKGHPGTEIVRFIRQQIKQYRR